METKIYKNYSEFLNREDKKENGVSESFAKSNANFENDNKTNRSCWNCSDCSDCSDCSYCSVCSYCSDCSGCSGCSDKKEDINKAPKIQNLNKSVLAAVTDNKLEMDNWHTCNTTHCWAGWIVHLAGKDGYELEQKTDTAFAAMQIYRASNNGERISPVNFYLDNEAAMNKIKELAKG